MLVGRGGVAVLMPSVLALPMGAAAVQPPLASGAPAEFRTEASGQSVSVPTPRVKPRSISIRVSGALLGSAATVKVTGLKGAAKGVKRSVRAKKRARVNRLKPGRYLIAAGRITAKGRTAVPSKPKRVTVTAKRGASVAIVYRVAASAAGGTTPPPATPPPATPPPPPKTPPLTPTTPPLPPTTPPPTTPPIGVNRPGTITAGTEHTCGLNANGAAWCWGADAAGQVGDGNDGQGLEFGPVQVVGGHTFTAITAGGDHTCGLDVGGAAWCWGSDFSGETGDGNDGQGFDFGPVMVVGGHTFTTITAGSDHTCALDFEGAAWCWGADTAGQVGDGFDGQGIYYSPVRVVGGRTFATLAAGLHHTCGLTAGGAAWCWGADAAGQVGDGDDGQGDEFSPVQVVGGHTFTTLSAGGYHTCGLTAGGAARCWGRDSHGQVGDGIDDQGDEYSSVAVVGGHTFKQP